MKKTWPLYALLAALPAGPAAAQSTTAGESSAPADQFADRQYWRDYRPQLDYHPIGMVEKGGHFTLSNLIRMHPSGFRADDFSLYFSPTYGVGKGWEVTAGVVGAERRGPGGTALFYGFGAQKQLVTENRSRPAVSVGGYGIFGPHSFSGGAGCVAATKLLAGGKGHPFALFLDGGGKVQTYSSDDYGDGAGIRPYVGSSLAINKRFFLGAEYSPAQPWARDDMFVVRGTYVVALKGQRLGISGGIQNVGYKTLPFIGISF